MQIAARTLFVISLVFSMISITLPASAIERDCIKSNGWKLDELLKAVDNIDKQKLLETFGPVKIILDQPMLSSCIGIVFEFDRRKAPFMMDVYSNSTEYNEDAFCEDSIKALRELFDNMNEYSLPGVHSIFERIIGVRRIDNNRAFFSPRLPPTCQFMFGIGRIN